MLLEITIRKDKYGHLFAYSKTCLFQFERRKEERCWYFWMRGHAYDPKIFRGKFPITYFEDACRANHFLDYGEGVDALVQVVSGKSYVGIK